MGVWPGWQRIDVRGPAYPITRTERGQETLPAAARRTAASAGARSASSSTPSAAPEREYQAASPARASPRGGESYRRGSGVRSPTFKI